MSNAKQPVVRVENLSKSFGGGAQKHVAVKPLTHDFVAGSLTGIVGESGSGKSTLSRMLAGLEKPTTGSVYYGDRELYPALRSASGRLEMRRTVQFVSQDTSSSFDPRHTLRQSLTYPATKLLGWNREKANEKVDELLGRLELAPSMADRYAHEVSGGQRQRFALARALIVSPRMLICDEVVSALDVSIQAVVLNHLKEICRDQGATLVFVSHGLPATAFVSDSLLVMLGGEVVESGSVHQILHEPKHSYTQALLNAYRGPDRESEVAR